LHYTVAEIRFDHPVFRHFLYPESRIFSKIIYLKDSGNECGTSRIDKVKHTILKRQHRNNVFNEVKDKGNPVRGPGGPIK
jgi:hypothetical protein